MSQFGLQQAFPEGISNVTKTNSVALGTRRWVGRDEYVYVFNSGNEDISTTFGCTISGGSGYSVTVSSVTSLSPFIGVVVHNSLTTDTFGWIMVKGSAKIEVGSTTSLGTAAGEQFAALGTGGDFDRITGSCDYKNIGMGGVYALTVTAAGGSCDAFIHGIG